MRYDKLLPRKRRMKDVHRIGLHGAVGMLVRKGNKVVRVCAECNKIIDEKRRMKEALKIVAKINKLGWIAKYILKKKYYEPNL